MKKDFDCVEMKREGQERLHARLAGLTPAQVREYWERRNREFDEQVRAAKETQGNQRRSA